VSQLTILDRLMGRSRPTLVAATEEVAARMLGNALGQVRLLIRTYGLTHLGTDPEKPSEDGWALADEMLALSLHVADRIAFTSVGPEKRDRVMDSLEQLVPFYVAQLIPDRGSSEPSREYETYFAALLHRRTEAYCGYPIDAPKADGVDGTLFWEAAKLMVSEYLGGDPRSVVVLSTVLVQQLELEPLRSLGKTLRSVSDL
jgi:hypothetical protein